MIMHGRNEKHFLASGSELWMFNEFPEKEREKKLTDGGLDISGLVNLKLVHREGSAVIRRHLESLPLETFDSILILADESVEDSVVHSDSRSVAKLLLIRDIQIIYLSATIQLAPKISLFCQSDFLTQTLNPLLQGIPDSPKVRGFGKCSKLQTSR